MNTNNKYQSVVYQIYPRSFNDSNGDGIGDIRGIIEKLDYLEKLGVGYIWSTPFFKSPQNDNGYDVSNYKEIDSLFGTMKDVEELIDEAQKRNIGIMFDMVLNHTSTEHEWFQKALAGQKEYQDYYFFKKKEDITNWESKFGGNAWQYVKEFDLYYLHLFDKTQADLNWENDDVFKGVVDIVNFWLEKGVKGLRFDVINLVSKPDVFEDDHQGDGRRFYTDGPRIHDHLRRLNKHSFGQYDDVITVGEMSSTNIENGVKYASNDNSELSMIFNFHHLKVDYKDNQKWALKPFDFIELKTILSDWQLAMQKHDSYMALFWSNHDQPRVLSRFGDEINYPKESAKMLATTIHCLRGMPYVYQGDEIGLPNSNFSSIDQYRDVESLNHYSLLQQEGLTQEEVLKILAVRSRDNGRTPIPWDNSQNHGFSKKEPWIDFSQSPALKSVEEVLEDNDSIFYHTQALIKLRKENKTISHGDIEFIDLDHPQLFVYKRVSDESSILVINNFYGEEVNIQLEETNGTILLDNYSDTKLSSSMFLKPYQSLIIETRSQ